MKYLKALILLLITSISSYSTEPEPTVHWYEITITTGTSTTSFTGSSPLNAYQISKSLNGTEPVTLESQREKFADPKNNVPMGWHPYQEGTRLFILPRAVLYFKELPADPADLTK